MEEFIEFLDKVSFSSTREDSVIFQAYIAFQLEKLNNNLESLIEVIKYK
jgi:hypothetical protein